MREMCWNAMAASRPWHGCQLSTLKHTVAVRLKETLLSGPYRCAARKEIMLLLGAHAQIAADHVVMHRSPN